MVYQKLNFNFFSFVNAVINSLTQRHVQQESIALCCDRGSSVICICCGLNLSLIYNFSNQFDFLFPFVSDYDNEYDAIKNQNQPGLKNFNPKINLNHNIYITHLIVTTLN